MAANIYHAATNARGREQKIKPRPNTGGEKKLKSEKWEQINASKLGNKFLLFLQTWSVFDSKPNKSNHGHSGKGLGHRTKDGSFQQGIAQNNKAQGNTNENHAKEHFKLRVEKQKCESILDVTCD